MSGKVAPLNAGFLSDKTWSKVLHNNFYCKELELTKCPLVAGEGEVQMLV